LTAAALAASTRCRFGQEAKRISCGLDQAVGQHAAEVMKSATIHFDGGGLLARLVQCTHRSTL